MKIYINGRFLTQKTTGVQRVAEEIVKEFDEILIDLNLENKVEVIILTPKNIIKNLKLKRIKIQKIGPFTGHLWEQLVLPMYTKGNMLINLCNTGPIYKREQVVMIHDAAVCSSPMGFSKQFVMWYRFVYKRLAKSANKIITVSNFSKQELVSYFPDMVSKIDVIYNGVDHIGKINPNIDILEKHNLRSEEFILAVSSMNPNKNFKIITDAIHGIKDFKGQVVIVGGAASKVFANTEMEFNNDIIWTGYVSDEELVALYKHAKVFVFPSLYEGFGLPPLEAMAVGCPVIASNAACIPEICGDHALYFDPNNAQDLIEKIGLVEQLRNPSSRIESKEFVEKYSWNRATIKLLEHIKVL
ncbi:glycosyltransferase family 4 protein [Bacillus wiedmannii]|uniref:glycosyltransferase family 4 protein n=2 Tax=Bacillus cereus group TaxID=86661 RepID=UPI000BF2170E|nr:glycosyltransferase family 1 protein [Bacillus wiedmannii]PEM31561.1 mannosyltransferase [Bacillus wiedmannii]